MNRIIVCETTEAKQKYRFDNTGIEVGSYEEFCFYMFENYPLFMQPFLTDELLYWFYHELGLVELSKQLAQMREDGISTRNQMLTILEEKMFYRDVEIRDLFLELDRLNVKSEEYQQKAAADLLVAYKRYLQAGSIYDSILEKGNQLELSFAGDVWHNRGVCYARNLEYDKASACFLNACHMTQQKDSCFAYFWILNLTETKEGIRRKIAQMGLPVEYYTEFMELAEREEKALENSPDYLRLQKAFYNKKMGSITEFNERYHCLIQKWKQEYRDGLA